ncbi:MAG: hypothetical protein ACXVPU_16505 [Bacteroidia bacterium]
MSTNYNNNSEEDNFLFGKNKELPFIVPQGYFDLFASQLINKIEALEELSEFETLASINKQTAFAVPENYFNGIENLLQDKNELAEFATLNKITKPVFKSLSADYANELNTDIIRKIEIADELKEYETLYAIDKQNIFTVATGYFDSIADDVKEKIYSDSHQKESIFERILKSVLKPKMAFAYSFVIILVTGSILYYKHNDHSETITQPSGDCKTLACLEKNEILNEKNVHQFDDDNLYEMVDVDQLDKQISGKIESDSVKVNKNDHIDSIGK